VSDLNAPVSGEVIAVNEKLEDEPTLMNTDCYGEGWVLKIKMSDSAELDALMDAEAYKAFSD
jgi:glycine cleavage system H protein